MATTTLARPEPRFDIQFIVAAVLIVWLLTVLILGATGAFVGRPRTPPIALAIGVAAPLLVFFTWLRLSQSFRRFVHSLDLRLVAGMQAWRWAGLGFLSLYAHNVLPAAFALPAGLGDMTVGLVAPWMVLELARQPQFAASRSFRRWNLFGILDLLIAIGIGTVLASFATGRPGEISTAPMATLPLLLIPAFLVPLFLMLHATALMRTHPARSDSTRGSMAV